MTGNRYTTQEAMKELGILAPATLRAVCKRANVKAIKGYLPGTAVVMNIWTQEMIDEMMKFKDKRRHPSGFTVERTEKKGGK